MGSSFVRGILLLFLVFLINGCGKEEIDDDSSVPYQEKKALVPNQGTYFSTFQFLNSSFNHLQHGVARIDIYGDEINVSVEVTGQSKGIMHSQFITKGDECPDLKADKNHDGHIDIIEAKNFYQKFLIPLDEDIDSQNSGYNIFPLTDLAGSYNYKKSASLVRMLADLNAPDLDSDDQLQKLKLDEDFYFEGKVIIILGVDPALVLPETLSSHDKLPLHDTVPVACGVLRRVRN